MFTNAININAVIFIIDITVIKILLKLLTAILDSRKYFLKSRKRVNR